MIFENGLKINKDELKRGIHSVDTHIFIRNDLWENLAEIQLNLKEFTGKPVKRSDLINTAIYFLCESLNLQECDDGGLALLLDAKERYSENLQRKNKQ